MFFTSHLDVDPQICGMCEISIYILILSIYIYDQAGSNRISKRKVSAKKLLKVFRPLDQFIRPDLRRWQCVTRQSSAMVSDLVVDDGCVPLLGTGRSMPIL